MSRLTIAIEPRDLRTFRERTSQPLASMDHLLSIFFVRRGWPSKIDNDARKALLQEYESDLRDINDDDFRMKLFLTVVTGQATLDPDGMRISVCLISYK